jgi:hypothetical protein
MENGAPRYKSELINARTFKALEDLLKDGAPYSGGKRWVLK